MEFFSSGERREEALNFIIMKEWNGWTALE